MKYLLILLLISTSAFAEKGISVRNRIGKEISHLPIKDDYGLEIDFNKSVHKLFIEGSFFVSKSNLSDTQGFTIGGGVDLASHRFSYVYFGEANREKWRLSNKTWTNTNWRSHNVIKYRYDFFIAEYHFINDDRDELLKDRLYLGFKFKYKDYFIKVKSDSKLTTINIGFNY